MNVYRKKNYRKCNQYYGRYYPQQSKPQKLYLYVDGDEQDFEIKHNPDVGTGVSCEIYTDRTLRFELPNPIYSKKEGFAILRAVETLVEELLKTFEIEWNGQNNCGIWDQELVEKLEKKLAEVCPEESELFFDDQGMMD